MPPIDRSNLRIGQMNARDLYERGRYVESFANFKELAESYRGNYLSAYWAGMAALRLGRNKEALAWFDRALDINPNYRPALDALETHRL
jgi:tetratricopeptide (TPR) repeat protein